MGLVNDSNREKYIKLMAKHYSHTKTEEQIRKEIEENPETLEGFVDYLEDGGRVISIQIRGI